MGTHITIVEACLITLLTLVGYVLIKTATEYIRERNYEKRNRK